MVVRGAVVVVVVVVVVVRGAVVAVGVGRLFETLSRTVLPCASFCPAAGLSATTVPFGCDDGTWTTWGVSPSRRSVAIAACCG